MRSAFLAGCSTVLGLASLAATACNGHDALCAMRYSDVTFVGSHDSAFVGPLITQNQVRGSRHKGEVLRNQHLANR